MVKQREKRAVIMVKTSGKRKNRRVAAPNTPSKTFKIDSLPAAQQASIHFADGRDRLWHVLVLQYRENVHWVYLPIVKPFGERVFGPGTQRCLHTHTSYKAAEQCGEVRLRQLQAFHKRLWQQDRDRRRRRVRDTKPGRRCWS